MMKLTSILRETDQKHPGTSVILTSNPRNPTGQVLTNPELAKIQDICRDRATLIMDEFYCGYVILRLLKCSV